MSPKRSPGSWSDEYESSRCRCAASTRWAGLHTASNLTAYPVGAQVFCFTREQQSAVTAGVRPEHQPPRGRVQLRNACAGGGRCSVGLPTEVAVAQDERRMAAAGAAGEAPTNLTVFGAALPAFAGARSRICRPSSTATMFGCGSTSGFVVGGPSTVSHASRGRRSSRSGFVRLQSSTWSARPSVGSAPAWNEASGEPLGSGSGSSPTRVISRCDSPQATGATSLGPPRPSARAGRAGEMGPADEPSAQPTVMATGSVLSITCLWASNARSVIR